MTLCASIKDDELRDYYRERGITLLDQPRIESPLGAVYLVTGRRAEAWSLDEVINGPQVSLERAPDASTPADAAVSNVSTAKLGTNALVSVLDRVISALNFGIPGLKLAAKMGVSGEHKVKLRVVGPKVERLRAGTLRSELAECTMRPECAGLGDFYVVTGAWSAYALDALVSDAEDYAVGSEVDASQIAGSKVGLAVKRSGDGHLIFNTGDVSLYYGVELMRLRELENGKVGLKYADPGSVSLDEIGQGTLEALCTEEDWPMLEVGLKRTETGPGA